MRTSDPFGLIASWSSVAEPVPRRIPGETQTCLYKISGPAAAPVLLQLPVCVPGQRLAAVEAVA
jgi:hypothetical protein